MAAKIYIPSNGAIDWKRLLADPEKQWRDGFSAKSAAERWEGSKGLPLEIEQQFVKAGLGPAELLLALPEWKTPLPGGDRESQADVFALVRTQRGVYACGVEAKVAEPFGPTVAEWLARASVGKLERIKHLCGTLGLRNPPPGLLRYQLLHRTASAIIEAERFGCVGAAMIVHSFSLTKAWLTDFQMFASALGVDVDANAPATMQSPNGAPLMLAWACGPPASFR